LDALFFRLDQVESANDTLDLIHAGNFAGIMVNIDNPGVAATHQNQQTRPAYINHQRQVILD